MPDPRTDPPSRYPGPLALGRALSRLALDRAEEALFRREGLRADVEYRDLGLAAATGGRVGAKHIRAIRPFDAETGWHWHDMSGHFVFVLKGWIEFRFAGVDDRVRVEAGSCLSQPAGVPHNVVGRSDDLELLEINLPADYGTWDLPSPEGAGLAPTGIGFPAAGAGFPPEVAGSLPPGAGAQRAPDGG
jgi:mannose-6-phosphate isomerase-like protein (cupin superfamily)